jgi:hypothetical protein
MEDLDHRLRRAGRLPTADVVRAGLVGRRHEMPRLGFD